MYFGKIQSVLKKKFQCYNNAVCVVFSQTTVFLKCKYLRVQCQIYKYTCVNLCKFVRFIMIYTHECVTDNRWGPGKLVGTKILYS